MKYAPEKEKRSVDYHKNLMRVAHIVELVLGLIILCFCVISTVGSVFTVDFVQLFQDTVYLQKQLSNICLIIIGIELIMMITSYSIDSVVDVMLLAVARQMIVEHSTPLDNLLTVVAVGLLFVIRKYMYISRRDRRHGQEPDEESGD